MQSAIHALSSCQRCQLAEGAIGNIETARSDADFILIQEVFLPGTATPESVSLFLQKEKKKKKEKKRKEMKCSPSPFYGRLVFSPPILKTMRK
jgi:hypothetical protein